jgi:peptidyl-dipeptidase Dcp
LVDFGMPREIVLRHRLPHFGHVFAGDGYSAGYYSYLWSDVITADSYGAFTEAGGPYDKAVAARLKQLLSMGNTVEPADAYRAFRGRDPRVEALMKKRGFTAKPAPGEAGRGT